MIIMYVRSEILITGDTDVLACRLPGSDPDRVVTHIRSLGGVCKAVIVAREEVSSTLVSSLWSAAKFSDELMPSLVPYLIRLDCNGMTLLDLNQSMEEAGLLNRSNEIIAVFHNVTCASS